MAAPTSLLGQARAFARDFPRDQMPRGYLWDVLDYVPNIIDAGLTGRGGWAWGSAVMGGDVTAGILAPFSTGEKILAITSNKRWVEVDSTPPYAIHDRGTAFTARQNPILWANNVVAFDGDAANVPQLLTAPGGNLAIASMDASAPHAPLGTVFGAYILAAGLPGSENTVYFSYPNQPAHAWDASSTQPMQDRITALGSLRSVVLVFHPGWVERIRGQTPPSSAAGSTGDLIPEVLFERVGCSDPKTIAYWQDNCVFADEHGCHITDGAVIRNLVSQGQISYFWRVLWGGKITAAACTFLDYYIITVRRSDGSSFTLVCDLNRRQWFRLSNFYALSMFASSGGTGMERAWGGLAGTNRLARIGPMFFPALGGVMQADDDGTSVLPVFETPWYRNGAEGRKRIRFAYLSYDVRTTVGSGDSPAGWREGFEIEPNEIPPEAPPEIAAALMPAVMKLDYITSPADTVYTTAGHFPGSGRYLRRKLPISRAPYGVGFRVTQLLPSSATRIYDLAADVAPLERSYE